MNRVRNTVYRAWYDLAVAVGEKDGYLSFAKQGEGIRMEPGPPQPVITHVPRSQLKAATMVTGAEDHDIAFAELHAHCVLGNLDVLRSHGLPRLQPLHPPRMRDVDEHASADNAVRVGRDIETEGASARERIRWPTVVKLALVRDVAKSVHVRVAITVKLHSKEVRGEANVTRADINIMGGVDIIEGRIRIVRTCDRVDRYR
jgi:hypothetical protein